MSIFNPKYLFLWHCSRDSWAEDGKTVERPELFNIFGVMYIVLTRWQLNKFRSKRCCSSILRTDLHTAYLTPASALLLSLSSRLPYPYVLIHLFVSPANGLVEPYTHACWKKNHPKPPTQPKKTKHPNPNPPPRNTKGFLTIVFTSI